MLGRAVPLFALVILACRAPAPIVPATIDAPPLARRPAAPVGPTPVAAGSQVVLRPGARVWLDAAQTRALELPQALPEGGIAVRVLEDVGGRLAVQSDPSARCASVVLADLRLQLFTTREALAEITTAPIEHALPTGRRIAIAAGAVIDGDAIAVPLPAGTVRVPVPATARGEIVPAATGTGPCMSSFAPDASPVAVADPLAAVLAAVDVRGAQIVVDAGAEIFWRDGTTAGTVAKGRAYAAIPTPAGARTCLPLHLAVDDEITVCFAQEHAKEIPAIPAMVEPVPEFGVSGILGGGGGSEIFSEAFVDGDTRFGMIGLTHDAQPKRRSPLPSVRLGKAKVVGKLDRDIVRRIVRAHVNQVRFCYDKALSRDPTLRGSVRLRFTIDADGVVSESTAGESPLSDPDLTGCMLGALGRWKFPKPADGGVVKVDFPFDLAPGSPE